MIFAHLNNTFVFSITLNHQLKSEMNARSIKHIVITPMNNEKGNSYKNKQYTVTEFIFTALYYYEAAFTQTDVSKEMNQEKMKFYNANHLFL